MAPPFPFSSISSLVRRLSFQAVETGSITAFLAICSIVLYSLLPESTLRLLHLSTTTRRFY